jgi:hypothetical protein
VLGDSAFETAVDVGRRMDLRKVTTLITTGLDEPWPGVPTPA